MAKRFIGNVKGVGVSDFSWEYYLSSSSAVLDGGSWSATPPTLKNNKYLWMRSKVTLTDGTIQYTVPVCEGVWEEIYGIYAIGDKVDGALSDVTDLKSRMTAEENKVQPLSKGGTGATTSEAARENLGLSLSDETKQEFADEGYPIEGRMSLLDKICQALLKILKKKDERVLLWENASPTSAYVKQKVALSLNAGDTVRIESCLFSNYTKRRTIQEFTVGQDGYLFQALSYIVWRTVFIDTSGVQFDTGQNTYVFNNTNVDNTACIPTRIWLIKSSGGQTS